MISDDGTDRPCQEAPRPSFSFELRIAEEEEFDPAGCALRLPLYLSCRHGSRRSARALMGAHDAPPSTALPPAPCEHARPTFPPTPAPRVHPLVRPMFLPTPARVSREESPDEGTSVVEQIWNVGLCVQIARWRGTQLRDERGGRSRRRRNELPDFRYS